MRTIRPSWRRRSTPASPPTTLSERRRLTSNPSFAPPSHCSADINKRKTTFDHAETRLNERVVIERAKAILIKQRRLSEPDAYKWLRRAAMSRGKRIVDVASGVIKDMEGTAG